MIQSLNVANNLYTSQKITSQEFTNYLDDGFLLLENIFKSSEIKTLSHEVDRVISDHNKGKHSKGLVSEENQVAIRTLNGLHLEYEIFNKLCCHPRILSIVQQILDDENVYVHQFKINLKEAFTGDVWEWHQDYIYWLKGDGMPEPKAITVAIFLDDVNEFNGPLMFIPGSHKQGLIDIPPREYDTPINQPSWMSNVTAKLKYPAPQEVVTNLIKERGLTAPKASHGSILLFDCNTLHASTNNLSPYSRHIILITYNPVTNVDLNFAHARPEFLASRNFSPLSVVSDNILEK